ncbi:MAG: preprotein translocase subunit YajC [Defluviitaleaceae bacterium]|nr:preprotein translocase subunit YajC [Defluviitaleaceae bacterium]
MNITRKTRKFRLALVLVASLFVFASCMNPGGNTGEGGGQVFVGGQEVGSQGTGGGTPPAQQGNQGTQQQVGQQPQEQPGGFAAFGGLLIPILLMFAVMYFLVIRPQRKQAKATRTMQDALAVGDNIVTTSGFFGKIVGTGTDSFLIEFGEGRGFKVWVRKNDIAGVKTPVMTPPPVGISDKSDKKD